jgi:predicted type IV restriction endonuclease
MKYIILLTTLLLTACGGTKDIEEFDARVKYCKENGATYKTVTNGLSEVFVYCLKDGIEFNSKVYDEVEK